MRALVLAVPLLIAAPVVALTQPDSSARAVLSPQPSPNLPESAKPSDALRAAQGALAAGRLREADEALEMAETRILDRSVPLGQTGNPSNNPTVRQISQARQALAAHDKATSMQDIQAALASATAQGL
jgi:hypothetical protein